MQVLLAGIEQDLLLIFMLVAGGSLGWQVRGQMVGAFQVKSCYESPGTLL